LQKATQGRPLGSRENERSLVFGVPRHAANEAACMAKLDEPTSELWTGLGVARNLRSDSTPSATRQLDSSSAD